MLAARGTVMRGSAMTPAPAPAPSMDNAMAGDLDEAGPGRRLAQATKIKTAAMGRTAVAPAGAVAGKVRPDGSAWFCSLLAHAAVC